MGRVGSSMSGETTAALRPPAFAEPIATERTFEQAIERIVEGIERSRLRHGDALPKEATLAAELGISKPTLRQALRVLERAGLIEVRRGAGGGIFLAAELVPIDLLRSQVAAEEGIVVETLVARRIIEGGATRLAAKAARPGDFEEMERTVELLVAAAGSRDQVMRADAAFHRAVGRASGNRSIQAAMRELARELAPIRDAYRGDPKDDRHTLDVHRRQIEAMRAGDLDALDRVLDEHFRQLEDLFASAVGSSWRKLFATTVRDLPPRR
ncbi:MAG: FadR family transcriptional regulator [Actinobacteria bacterium]|nr:FadR family transcriptional regulator [Actinomycetota bacterium]